MTELDQIEIFPLEASPPPGFRCARDEQNTFLHDRAWPEQHEGLSVTYLAHLYGMVVAYMTLAMDAIPLQTREKPSRELTLVRYPAIKLAQLATHEHWEGRGIGKHLVAVAAGIGLELRGRVGCRYLTVDAKPDLLEWYAGQEFKVNKLARREQEERAGSRGVSVEALPVSMRLDLFSLLADLRDVYPNEFPRA